MIYIPLEDLLDVGHGLLGMGHDPLPVIHVRGTRQHPCSLVLAHLNTYKITYHVVLQEVLVALVHIKHLTVHPVQSAIVRRSDWLV